MSSIPTRQILDSVLGQAKWKPSGFYKLDVKTDYDHELGLLAVLVLRNTVLQ